MPVFLFSDIEGSTQKWETYRDLMAKALAAHDEIMLSCMNRFGGKIIKNTGDGVFAMFENRSALQCALILQEEVGKVDWSEVKGLKVRLGLHAGEAEKRGEDYFGPVINRTARILATGWGGQIVLTPDVLSASTMPEGAEAEQLGTHLLKDLPDPQPLLGLVHKADPEKFPPLRSLSSRPNNLPPQSTPFFGREKERQQIADHLKDPTCRLLTLAGQGGMGKTRLALQAAEDALDHFKDGVYFVPLAPVANPEDLVSTIGGVLGFSFVGESDRNQQLIRYLKDRSMLLVLDNFEHLLPGAAFVGEMLDQSPKIKAIVSSRSHLGLPAEWVMELTGLSCPDGTQNSSVESSDAVQFFVACAKRLKAGFVLAEADVPEVFHICRLVDGVPLGIELAAAWIQTLSCKGIREEVEKNIDFLASKSQGRPERHQSIRAVFEYSWKILSEEEQLALCSMSIFRGGFLRDAAEKITGSSLILLSALLDKSLLKKSPSDRFEMHELIRQFAEEKLKTLAVVHRSVRDRHADYFCDFVAVREKKLVGSTEREGLQEIDNESDNVRVAWSWVVEKRDARLIDRVCNALFEFFEGKALAREGEDTFGLAAAAFSAPECQDSPEAQLVLSKMVARQGWFLYQQGRIEKAEALMKEGLALSRKLKKDKETGECLHFLCALYSFQRKMDQQETCAKESYGIFSRLEDDLCVGWSLFHLAQKPKQDQNNELAKSYFLKSLELFRKVGYGDGMAWNLVSLGQIAMQGREFDAAKKYFNESLSIFERTGNKISSGMILLELAHLHEDIEDYEPAYQLAKQAYESFQTSNNRLRLAWAQLYCTDSAFNMGRWEDSLNAGQDALRLFAEEEDKVGQGWTYANLCRAHNQGGQFEEGLNYGRKGLDIFTRLGDKEGMCGCQYHLAFSEIGLQHLKEAEELFFSALRNGLARKIHWRIMDALFGVALIKDKTGNPSLSLFIAWILIKDEAIGKDMKSRTSKLIADLQAKLKKSEMKVVEEKIKPFTTDTLAVQLLAQRESQVRG